MDGLRLLPFVNGVINKGLAKCCSCELFKLFFTFSKRAIYLKHKAQVKDTHTIRQDQPKASLSVWLPHRIKENKTQEYKMNGKGRALYEMKITIFLPSLTNILCESLSIKL